MVKNTPIKNSKPKIVNKDMRIEQKRKRFTIDIPVTLHTKLKITAVKRGLTMKEMICDALEEIVK